MKSILSALVASFLIAAVVVVSGASIADRIAGRSPMDDETALSPWPNSPEKFDDLEKVIAREGIDDDWVVHVPPNNPGPYRAGLWGRQTVGRDPNAEIAGSWHDATGAMVAKYNLRGDPRFDQMVMCVESQD